MKKIFKIIFLFLLFFMISGCITPDDPAPEEEEDDGIVYHDLTMNNDCVGTLEVQTLLALRGESLNYSNSPSSYKLTYRNENNDTILLSVIVDTTVGNPIIELKYNDDIYRIASENVKTINYIINPGFYGYYDEANVWTKLNGQTTFVSNSNTITVDRYSVVNRFPVFSGDWIIDNTNSTSLGKEYLSSILFESTGDNNEITIKKKINNAKLNANIDITEIYSGTVFTDGYYKYGNHDNKVVYNKENSQEKLVFYFDSTSSGSYTNLFLEYRIGNTLIDKYIYSNDSDAYRDDCYSIYTNVKNKWAILSADKYCYYGNNNNYYKELGYLPFYSGTWVLDESTVNDNNKGIFSLNVLVDSNEIEKDTFYDLTFDNYFLNSNSSNGVLNLKEYVGDNYDYYKLTYKSGSNYIKIYVVGDSTFQEPIIVLDYNGNKYYMASSSAKYTNSNNTGSCGYGEYEEANKWLIKSGVYTHTCYHGTSEVDYYTVLTSYPIFYGKWTLDAENSTQLGKRFLTFALIEVK